MTSSVNYAPLPLDPSGKIPHSCAERYCSCLNRTRICAAALIIILSSAFILFTCLSFSWFQRPSVCPTTNHHRGSIEIKNGKIHYKHTRKRLPHCIIIGVRKGGTRALLQYLKMHPDIQTASEEIHYFDDNVNYSKGLEWYRKKMPFSYKDQLTIEKTPAYFVHPKVPERLFHVNSSIKLILLVREPVDRAISDYVQISVVKHRQDKYFPKFEDLAIDEETGEVNLDYKALTRSIYDRHMERWLNYFSLDQIHFVDSKKLVEDPYEEVYKVEEFLGISHSIKRDNFYFSPRKGFYCLDRPIKGKKCLAKSKGRKHPNVDPEVVEKLKEFFEPHNRLFFDQINKTFDW